MKFPGTVVPSGITVVTVYEMSSPIVAWAAVLLGPSVGVVAAFVIVTLRVTTFEKLSAAGTFGGVTLAGSMLLAGV